MTNCRVSEDLTTYLEDCAEQEMAQWDSEVEETEVCEVCGENVPTTEIKYEGICEVCADAGHMWDEGTFMSEVGDLYAV